MPKTSGSDPKVKTAGVLNAPGSTLSYEGCNYLRQRVVLSLLSGKSLRITDIRIREQNIGLTDFEVCFLKLVNVVTNGTKTDINKSGTTLSFVPGVLTGGRHSFVCDSGRAIGYYVEPLLMLAPFCKLPLHLTLSGVTNNGIDISVDSLKAAWFPALRHFILNDENLELKVTKRGFAPSGHGQVVLQCPICKQLTPVHVTKPVKVTRIRGIAFGSRVSPALLNRMISSVKEAFADLLSDVFITVDHRKGNNASSCPGYGIHLRADTTSDRVVYTSDAMCQPPGADTPSVPEDVGRQAAQGGACDSTAQSLVCLFMCLGQPDVSQFFMGPLSNYTVNMLRHIRDYFNVTFKIESVDGTGQPVGDRLDDQDGNDEESLSLGCSQKTLLTCVGVGYSNMNKMLL